jgi:signal transduction histidine kinase
MADLNGRKESLARELFELRRYVSERVLGYEDLEPLMAWIDDACLEEMEQLPDEHIAGISHELRTPLGSVKLYASLLHSGASEKYARYTEILRREVERLHEEVENLLSLSRLERGAVSLNIAPIDLNHVTAIAIARHAHSAVARQLALCSELHSDAIWLRGDLQWSVKALSHLIHNAIQFTPQHGTVVVRTRPLEQQGWGQTSVQDSGPGIALDEQVHIFGPMYRGRAALESGAPGAGLGLAICRQIVERMGGRIEVQSTLGAGATFSVSFKLAEHI